MKYLAGLLLLLSWGAFAADVGLRIDCDSRCQAWPASLNLESNDQVIVTSAKKWTCAVFVPGYPKQREAAENPSEKAAEVTTVPAERQASETTVASRDTGNPPASNPGANDRRMEESTPVNCVPWTKAPPQHQMLIFESKGVSAVQVPFEINVPSRKQNLLPFSFTTCLALVWLALSMGSLILVVMALLASRKPAQGLEEWEKLQTTANQLKGTVDEVFSELNFIPIRHSTSLASQVVSGQALRGSRAPTPTPLDDFMVALDGWSNIVRPTPSGIVALRKRVESMGGVLNAGELQAWEQDIVEQAIAATDLDFDPQHRDQHQQRALDALIKAAGLRAIYPKELETFNPDAHRSSAQRVQPPDRRYCGFIASVVIRGLERDGRVIKKAEVSLFD